MLGMNPFASAAAYSAKAATAGAGPLFGTVV
jgi:hypothetical protein